MKRIKYTKINGAGNDFVLIDKRENPDLLLSEDIIKKLSNREEGIGADGVIMISDSVSLDFEMLYFNADGTTGSLCANGARCAVKYADISERIKNKTARFLSNGIEYSGEVIKDNLIKFYLNPPRKLKYDFKIKALRQLINACFVDTGSPHVVIKISDALYDPKKNDTI